MGLRITLELDDKDLQHFSLIMREARNASAMVTPEDIVEACEQLLADVDGSGAPGFILERLDKLRTMIDMLSDIDWRLPQADANRALNALAYFVEPEDLIPDHIPGLGLLDDAIMIELVVRELQHEIEAYEDFCRYRQERRNAEGATSNVSRDEWLDERRKHLQSRMHRRRKQGGPGRKSKLRLFS